MKNEKFKMLTSKIDELSEKLGKIESKIYRPIHFLTSKQASQVLQVSTRTLQKYRDQGIIPFIQFGREVRFHAEDIQLFLMDHYVKPSNWKGGLS